MRRRLARADEYCTVMSSAGAPQLMDTGIIRGGGNGTRFSLASSYDGISCCLYCPPRRTLWPCVMLSALVALFSISSLGLFYRATSDSAIRLSPQGCRMSYMSPSYLIQSQFDSSWTPLAKRYSLQLYREVGWEDDEVGSFMVSSSLSNDERIK